MLKNIKTATKGLLQNKNIKTISNMFSKAGIRKGNILGTPTLNKWGKGVGETLQKTLSPTNRSMRRLSLGSQIAVGTAGMTAISVMNGGMTAANNNLTAKYMRDSRYSSRLLQHRVGNRMSSPLNVGNHTGLSLALSSSRHG